jgi:lysophospholipase L1-like esterase
MMNIPGPTGAAMSEDQQGPSEADDPYLEADDPYLLPGKEADALLRDAPWIRFAAVGDSTAAGITEAFPGYATRSWFDRVDERLRIAQPSLVQLNLGRSRALAAQVRAEQLAAAVAFAPDLTVVLSGGNDILQRQFDPDATAGEIASVVSALVDAGSTVVMTGVFDITNSPYVPERYRQVMSERIAQLSAVIASIARQFDVLHAALGEHPAGTEAIYSTDGLHLNARGQAILATEVMRCLGRQLMPAGPDGPTGSA